MSEPDVNLPPNWVWATIEQLSGSKGVLTDGDWIESKDQDPSGDIRLIQLADVGDGFYRNKSNRYMTKKSAEKLGCTYLQDGDLLIARMPDPLGRACIFPGDEKKSVTVVDVVIVRSSSGEFDHRWLMYFVNAHQFRSAVSALQSGSTRKRISRKNLASIRLPVPPLPEQRRIVAEIEKQFTRLESGISALLRIQSNLKKYRESLIRSAYEGRLIAVDRDQSSLSETISGNDLANHLEEARRQKWKGRGLYKQALEPSHKILKSTPESWVWLTLDAVAEIKGGITKDQNKKHTHPTRRIPYLRVANVQRGYFDLADVKEIDAGDEAINQLRLTRGDILFNEGGDRDKLGRGWVWNEEIPECIHQNHVFRARLYSDLINPKFISWYANSFGQSYFFDEGTHTTNLASISITKLKALPVPVPPAHEQALIVAELEYRLSSAESLESIVSLNLKRASNLRESILKKAYTGTLVPQIPSEGSAQAILDSVLNEKTPSNLTKSKTSTKRVTNMSTKKVATLHELADLLNSSDGSMSPDRLLLAAGLGNDVEMFFDLLREGSDKGVLIVPTGEAGLIKRKQDAN
jgi:type I restriction enzyme S subunit